MAVPKILGNSVIYTGVTILQKCLAFFLLPLYTSYLTPADFGVLGVVLSVSGLLAIFTTLGLDSACGRFYYKYHGASEYIKRLFGTIACVILINSAFFGAVFLLAHKCIVDPLLGEISFYPCVLLGLLNVLVAPLYLLFQSYLQTIQDGLTFGVNSISNFLLQVALTILFVVPFRMGVAGALMANLITSVVFFIYVFIAFFRHQKIGIDKQILRESFQYSLPLLPHIIANWSNATIDKLLVNGIRSESDAGLYNLGSQYSSVANTMSIAINSAYVPWFFDKANDIKNNLVQIRKMSEMITWIVCLFCLGMALLAQEVLTLMIHNPEYDGVWKVVPFLICGTIFGTIYFFYVNVLFLKNTGIIFIITVSTIVVNILLNIWLIPFLGVVGCGIAFMVTFFVKSLLALFISMKKNKEIRFRSMYLYTIGIVSSTFCVSALFFENMDIVSSILIKIIIILCFGGYIYFTYKSDIMDLIYGIVSEIKL